MKILLAEDERSIRRGMETYLAKNNFDVTAVDNGLDAYNLLTANNFDLVISDINMPKKNGIELLKDLRCNNKSIPMIMITAYGSIENAVDAMKLGADDYLTKPINLFELRIRIDKTLKNVSLEKDNARLKNLLTDKNKYELVGESIPMKRLREMLLKIKTNSDISILIAGESGTGKELAARNIHMQSNRNKKNFVSINCAAISSELFESELFGHVAGAYTGAVNKRDGLFLTASEGTLFLDEIAEMPLSLQAKLLRVLQENKIRPVGSDKDIEMNTRVICATNKNLAKEVANGNFREDLYYRINVIEVNLPSLRERPEDIPDLIKHFMHKNGIENKTFSDEAFEVMICYCWPGNIRELENTIKRILITSENKILQKSDIPDNILSNTISSKISNELLCGEKRFQEAIKKANMLFEKDFIEYHLKRNSGNISKTSNAIELSRATLHKKIKEYNIKIDQLR